MGIRDGKNSDPESEMGKIWIRDQGYGQTSWIRNTGKIRYCFAASPAGEVRRSRSVDSPLVMAGISPLVTPVKGPGPPPRSSPSPLLRTPGKFRGKTDEEIVQMSEEDQVEILLNTFF